MVARRPADRLRLGPPPEPGPRLAQRHLPRRRARRGAFVSSRRVAGRQRGAAPSWSPDGRWVAAIGTRDWKRGELAQASVWRIRARDGHAENLIPEADLEAAGGMSSDLIGGLPVRPAVDGRRAAGSSFAAPVEGSFELWRVEVDGGRVERLTRDRHYLARTDLVGLPRGGARVAAVRSDRDARAGGRRRRRSGRPAVAATIASSSGRSATSWRAWSDVKLVAPVERWHEVDGRRIQGWFYLGSREHEAQPGAGRPRDPRRAGDALRLVADVGVAAAGRVGHQRLRLQPARLAGLRPGLPDRERPRLGRRTDARRHGRPRLADRGRARRRRPDGRHRRLVRRVPHLVDRRPHRSVQGGGHLPIGQRPDQPDALRRHRRTRPSGCSSTASIPGRTGTSTAGTRR